MHACDRQTDGRTESSSLYRVCITCSAVKMIKHHTKLDVESTELYQYAPIHRLLLLLWKMPVKQCWSGEWWHLMSTSTFNQQPRLRTQAARAVVTLKLRVGVTTARKRLLRRRTASDSHGAVNLLLLLLLLLLLHRVLLHSRNFLQQPLRHFFIQTVSVHCSVICI